jgi:Holliday junction resolvasome RuvABC endonuclease subunit
MSAKICGLDWSMSCPCICVYDTKLPLTFNNCKFYFYIDSKKYDKSFANMHGFKTDFSETEEERFDNIAEWAIKILKKNNVTEACLEGYSMGSKGRIFAIAENIGLLKHKMWKAGIKFVTPAPTQIKKTFTGKGNANKEAMFNALKGKFDIDLPTILQCKADASPLADIVDAFALVDYYVNHRG